MKFFGLIFVLVFSFSCSKEIKCKIEDSMVEYGSKAVASQLNCENEDAVKKTLSSIIKGLNICDSEMGIGAEVCKVGSSMAIDVLGKKIPSEWECDPEATADTLKSTLESACDQIPY